jgi:hypothetical protein
MLDFFIHRHSPYPETPVHQNVGLASIDVEFLPGAKGAQLRPSKSGRSRNETRDPKEGRNTTSRLVLPHPKRYTLNQAGRSQPELASRLQAGRGGVTGLSSRVGKNAWREGEGIARDFSKRTPAQCGKTQTGEQPGQQSGVDGLGLYVERRLGRE